MKRDSIDKPNSKPIVQCQWPVEKPSQPKTTEFRVPPHHQMGYMSHTPMTVHVPVSGRFLNPRMDGQSGKCTSIFSLPFYTSQCGYKLVASVCISWVTVSVRTLTCHCSLLSWRESLMPPYWLFTSFRLINQHHRRDIVDVFQPDPLSSSFHWPKMDMYLAWQWVSSLHLLFVVLMNHALTMSISLQVIIKMWEIFVWAIYGIERYWATSWK